MANNKPKWKSTKGRKRLRPNWHIRTATAEYRVKAVTDSSATLIPVTGPIRSTVRCSAYSDVEVLCNGNKPVIKRKKYA